MIDRDHGLLIAKQARALGISRGSVYYSPGAASPADLAIMRRMDEPTSTSLSPAAGCCATCSIVRGLGSAVGMSRR